MIMKWLKLSDHGQVQNNIFFVCESANRFAWLQDVFSLPLTELYIYSFIDLPYTYSSLQHACFHGKIIYKQMVAFFNKISYKFFAGISN